MGAWGNVCCVAAVLKIVGVLSLGVLTYVVCLCRGCVVFCMTCSLLMLVEDAIGDHTEEAYSRADLITVL